MIVGVYFARQSGWTKFETGEKKIQIYGGIDFVK